VQLSIGISSSAGLEAVSAMVPVGPPLSARPAGSSSGSVSFKLPVPVKLQESSLEML
jgi:hypothetical protein